MPSFVDVRCSIERGASQSELGHSCHYGLLLTHYQIVVVQNKGKAHGVQNIKKKKLMLIASAYKHIIMAIDETEMS